MDKLAHIQFKILGNSTTIIIKKLRVVVMSSMLSDNLTKALATLMNLLALYLLREVESLQVHKEVLLIEHKLNNHTCHEELGLSKGIIPVFSNLDQALGAKILTQMTGLMPWVLYH